MCVGCLCTGEKGVGTSGKPLSYKGSRFHRVIKGCVVSYLLFYYFCTMLIGVLAHFVFCPWIRCGDRSHFEPDAYDGDNWDDFRFSFRIFLVAICDDTGSWSKEETSRRGTVREASRSMARSSRMRRSLWSTIGLCCFPWYATPLTLRSGDSSMS